MRQRRTPHRRTGRLRPPYRPTGVDRSGYLIRMEDQDRRPFFVLRSRFDRYVFGGR